MRAKNQATGAMEYTGRVSMKESSANVKPWRAAVTSVALPYARRPGFLQLDGPLIADMVFTMARPKALPRWNVWPAVIPDLSKLLRSTEDALTGNIWKDDGRVVSYRRLEKVYVGSDDPDALHAPGAVIRVWRLPEQMIEERRALTSRRSS